MRRATAILPAGTWRAELAVGIATLAYDERHRRRFRYATDDGQDILLDPPQAVLMRDCDGLALEGGGAVLVRAADEDLVEIAAASAPGLARIAYRLGNSS